MYITDYSISCIYYSRWVVCALNILSRMNGSDIFSFIFIFIYKKKKRKKDESVVCTKSLPCTEGRLTTDTL